MLFGSELFESIIGELTSATRIKVNYGLNSNTHLLHTHFPANLDLIETTITQALDLTLTFSPQTHLKVYDGARRG
jgi:hypothetical protein